MRDKDTIFFEVCMKIKKLLAYFSLFEWLLWGVSVGVIIFSFFFSQDRYSLTLIASLLGVTALIFLAKGNVVGQFLTVVFSLLYAIVSIRFRYWGEMVTYVFMSLPAAVFSCVSWLKHPSKESKNEVEVGSMTGKKWLFASLLSVIVTLLFYFILRYFDTPNLWLSTLSVSTSFFASALLFLRSRYYAVAYALNDIVLIGLWIFASIQSLSYLPMVVCFLAFLCNDLYAFINWKRIQIRQNQAKNKS